MTSSLQGHEKLLAQLKDIEGLDWVAAEVEGMQIIADEAKILVPVDTGDLQASIGVEVDGEAVNLVAGGGDVDYALYVEMGTYKMMAQPYMRPAIDAKKKECDKAIAKNLEAQMRSKV